MDKSVVNEFGRKLELYTRNKPVTFNEQERGWLRKYHWFQAKSGLQGEELNSAFLQVFSRVVENEKESHGGYFHAALNNACMKLAIDAMKGRNRRYDRKERTERFWRASTSRRDMRADFADAMAKIHPEFRLLLQERLGEVPLRRMAERRGVDEKEIRRQLELAKDAIRPHLRSGYEFIGLPTKNLAP